MTDPERISLRGGFAAQLLRAGASEQPGETGLERTLVALGVSGVVLASSTAVSAAAASTKLAGVVSSGTAALSTGAAASGASGAVSAALLVKWIGIGVVSGVSLAGAAAMATGPASPEPVVVTRTSRGVALPSASPAPVSSAAARFVAEAVPAPEPSLVAPAAPRASVVEPRAATPENELGMPLSAEVAFVDRGRAQLAAGRTLEGLALLEGYEQEFRDARLLPEVLFLRLEAYERLGRTSDARRCAERLVSGFPKSPHAARARKLLGK